MPNPHFLTVSSIKEASRELVFEPLTPSYTANQKLCSLAIFIMDHKFRKLPKSERTLEIDYESFGFSQVWKGSEEARRWAVEVIYGRFPDEISIAGHEGRSYELGPEVSLDDIDGRSPAVVTWYNKEIFYLLSSGIMPSSELRKIAESVYT